MRHAARCTSLAFLVIAKAACAQVPEPGERLARLDAILETQARELLLPGVSAALVERGELVWTGARGWADVEARVPVTLKATDTVTVVLDPSRPHVAFVRDSFG